ELSTLSISLSTCSNSETRGAGSTLEQIKAGTASVISLPLLKDMTLSLVFNILTGNSSRRRGNKVRETQRPSRNWTGSVTQSCSGAECNPASLKSVITFTSHLGGISTSCWLMSLLQ